MFRIIAIIGIAVAILVAVVLRSRHATGAGESRHSARRPSLWVKLFFAATMLSLAVLALTGFYASIVLGRQMSGLLLMFHAGLGGLFFSGLAAMVVSLAESCRFTDQDWSHSPSALGAFTRTQKLYFWALALFGFMAIISMLTSMLPIFGAQGQEVLYQVHRASALLLAMGGISFVLRK